MLIIKHFEIKLQSPDNSTNHKIVENKNRNSNIYKTNYLVTMLFMNLKFIFKTV